MVRDYSGIDWNEPTPTGEAVSDAFDLSSVSPRPLDRRLQRIADVFHEDRTSANLRIGQFDLDLRPPVTFFLSRNRLADTFFFTWFFSQPEVRRAFPDLGPLLWSPYDAPDSHAARMINMHLGLKLTDGWDGMAMLASWVRRNGHYLFADPPGDRQTMKLVLGAAGAAFQGQPSRVLAFAGHERWAEWFWGMENATLFWLDRPTGLVTTILLTDGP